MAAPTTAEVRAAFGTRLDFTDLGYPAGDPDPLDPIVESAVEFVEWATGQDFDSMPSEFDATADRAVRLTTALFAYQESEDVLETLGDFGLIQSFSAGDYSETRRSIAELSKSGIICNSPPLHKALWSMMTDEKRDEWQTTLTGVNAPAFEVTEVDWSFWTGGADDYAGL